MITARLKPARTRRIRKRRSMTARMGRQWIVCVSCRDASFMSRSTPLEGGFALFDERPRALAHVLGGAAQTEKGRLHRQPFLECHLQPLVHGLQSESQGRRPARQE